MLRASSRVMPYQPRDTDWHLSEQGEHIQRLLSIVQADEAVTVPQEEPETRLRTLPEHRTSRCVLYPDDPFKMCWDCLVLMYLLNSLMMYTVLVTPYRVAFVEEDTLPWFAVDLTVDALFMLDVLVNCVSAYYSADEVLVTSNKRIFLQYLKFWLFFDLIACLPFQLIFGSSTEWGSLIRLGRLPRLYRVVKFAKLFRMLKVYKNRSKVLSCFEGFSGLSAGTEHLLYFLSSFLCISHLLACVLYFGTKLIDPGPYSWVLSSNMQDEAAFDIYIASFYWTVTTITTIGYGDIVPGNSLERGLCIVIMIGGIFFYSYTIGTITTLLTNSNHKKTKLESRLVVLQRISKQFRLSKTLFGKLKSALSYDQADLRRERNEVLSLLPKKLANQLYLIMNEGLVRSNAFFDSRPLDFIVLTVKYLKPLRLAPREYLFRKGEFSEEMYFLVKGQVALYEVFEDEEVVYTVLGSGEYFGDVELFLSEIRQTASRALDFSELLSLSKDDLFTKVLKHFEEIKVDMIVQAHKNNIVLNEQKCTTLDQKNSELGFRTQSLLMRKRTSVLLDRARRHTDSYRALRHTLAPSTRARLDDSNRRSQCEALKRDLQEIRGCVKRMLESIARKRVNKA